MKNQAAIIAILLFVNLTAKAQEMGTVELLTKPPIGTTVAKLGDTIVQHGTKVVMPVGTYQLTLWAPYYGAVTKTVTVLANETVTVKEYLVFSKEVQDYQQVLSDYNHLVIRQKVLPYAGTGLLVAGSTIAWIRARRFQRQAFDWKHKYERVSSTASIDDAQHRFAEAKKKSRNAKVTLYTLGGLSAGGCYLSWKGYEKIRSLEKPVKPQPVRPFELTGISTGFSNFSLTFNF